MYEYYRKYIIPIYLNGNRYVVVLDIKILILGLDGADKTTILYNLYMNEVVTTVPTIGFNMEAVQNMTKKFKIWDLSGEEKLRPLLEVLL